LIEPSGDCHISSKIKVGGPDVEYVIVAIEVHTAGNLSGTPCGAIHEEG